MKSKGPSKFAAFRAQMMKKQQQEKGTEATVEAAAGMCINTVIPHL